MDSVTKLHSTEIQTEEAAKEVPTPDAKGAADAAGQEPHSAKTVYTPHALNLLPWGCSGPHFSRLPSSGS